MTPLLLLRTLLIFPFLAVAAAAPVSAGDRAVVVELFTSQGCSSCPPADILFADIARGDNVIALAYHVDYWDYLGWKDSFGSPEFTRRQYEYSKVTDRQWIDQRLRGKFTPEIVVQGVDSLVGHDRKAIARRIAAHGAQPHLAAITLERGEGAVLITLTPLVADHVPSRVMLVTFMAEATVAVERGENAGKTLRYSNIVTQLSDLGAWDGKTARSLRATVPAGPFAVLLQSGKAGPIIAAAQLQ